MGFTVEILLKNGKIVLSPRSVKVYNRSNGLQSYAFLADKQMRFAMFLNTQAEKFYGKYKGDQTYFILKKMG